MKRFQNFLFVFAVSFFLIHQYLQKFLGIKILIVDSYLDPLLAMPILLHLVNLERKWLFKKDVLSQSQMWGYCCLLTIAGEVIFPKINLEFTYDLWDIVPYSVGTLLYIAASKATGPIVNQPARVLFAALLAVQ
jgi:hypothetical protein